MDYVQKSLNLMDKLVEYFGYSPEKDNYYSSIVQFLYEKSQSGAVEIEKCLREEITVYLESLEIEDEKILICKFLGMTVNENFVVPENTSFDLLDDRCFLCFLVTVLRTISWVQSDNLLLVKYSKNIWNTGWHNLAKICRGKVYDLNTHNIVVYPFDKFFNLNEVEETKEERVQELLGKAKEIYVTDKKDGSAIIVTNYNGNVILNTNGQFKNIQIDLARKLFNEKYKGFIENVPEGYTFVFELIHPDNAIVLDYGQEKKLYLLAIRDLTTFKLKSYPELVAFAEEYNLDITESFEYTNLSTFIDKALNETANIKEGWVFRVVTDEEDFMFKLKYLEYFRIARLEAIPSLKKVYNLMLNDQIDDVLSIAESNTKKDILADIRVLNGYIDRFKKYIEEEVKGICDKYNISVGNLENDSAKLLSMEYKQNPFFPFIMRSLRNGLNVDELFVNLPGVTPFERLYKFINKIDGIEEDNWELRK